MSTPTQTTFDFASFKRSLESWDVDGILELYDADVEFKQIDKDSPPSSPRIVRGKDTLAELYCDWASRGLETRIADVVAADGKIALAITCRYPTGECVYEHSIIDVRDGKIVRQVGVEAWDE